MKEKLRSMIRETGKWHDILPIAIVWAVMIGWLVFIIGYTAPELAFIRLFSSNDEILAELEKGALVLYKGERYRWCGIEKNSFERSLFGLIHL